MKLEGDLAHLVFVANPVQHPQGDFILSHGRGYTFDQQQQGEALTYSGVAVIHPKMFMGLDEGKRPLAPLLKQAMLEQKVSASKMNAIWVDVGTPERLKALDQQIKQDNCV